MLPTGVVKMDHQDTSPGKPCAFSAPDDWTGVESPQEYANEMRRRFDTSPLYYQQMVIVANWFDRRLPLTFEGPWAATAQEIVRKIAARVATERNAQRPRRRA